MRALLWSTVGLLVVVIGGAVLLAGLAGAVRLMPWLLAREVPWSVVVPFARVLLGAAIETGVLLGAPIALAVTAARWVERGEAGALFGLGASPGRMVRGIAPAVALAVFGWCWLGGVIVQDVGAPGRLVRATLEEGQATCGAVEAPTSVRVPMVALTWLCAPGVAPRLVGQVPGLGGSLWLGSSGLRPSDDLSSFELNDLELAAPKGSARPALRVRAALARIHGLPSWGPPPRLGLGLRAVVVACVAVTLGLCWGWIVLRVGVVSQIAALAMAGGSALSVLWALHAVDRAQAGLLGYALLPVGGLASVLASVSIYSLLVRASRRALGRWLVPSGSGRS